VSALLSVDGLSVSFGGARVVDGVSFQVPAGGTVGVVGESGSGKSVTALAILRLLSGAEVRGRVDFEGADLLRLPDAAMRGLRGARLAMVFQDPMTSLNPALRVGEQIGEALRVHQGATKAQALREAERLLAEVGVPEPGERVHAYPHELSGGLRQRAVIAMALACGPQLLLADEPTTALDVTVQAQVMEVLSRLQRERQMGLVLISHDLGLVAERCETVVVMYAGQVVEQGLAKDVLRAPRHPYTKGLLESLPPLAGPRARLTEIPGVVPDPKERIAGCRFASRCAAAQARCREQAVEWTATGANAGVRCHFPLEGAR
jgi:peptide/nickel transport system ATP-binding protein